MTDLTDASCVSAMKEANDSISVSHFDKSLSEFRRFITVITSILVVMIFGFVLGLIVMYLNVVTPKQVLTKVMEVEKKVDKTLTSKEIEQIFDKRYIADHKRLS